MSIIGDHLRDDCMRGAYSDNFRAETIHTSKESLDMEVLRRENHALRRKIAALEKQISDDGWRLNPDRIRRIS